MASGDPCGSGSRLLNGGYMSRQSRREWCDEHGEEFPMQDYESFDENEQRHFECPNCGEWFLWTRRVYVKEIDDNFCDVCAPQMKGIE